MAASIPSSVSPTPSAILSRTQRLEGIAVLLNKAILLADAQAAIAPPKASPRADTSVDSHDERIVRFLRVGGSGSPATIRQALGLPRTTVYRALVRLTKSGAVSPAGKTRALAYVLAENEPPSEVIARN